MSVVSDIRRGMRPANLRAWEHEALFKTIDAFLRRAPFTEHVQAVEIPSVTDRGGAYLLTLYMRGGRIVRWTVDHDPDQTAACFAAYHEKRTDWAAERAATKKDADR